MSSRRPWSLTARLTRWFAFTCAALSIVVLALGSWYVRLSLQREIAALANEELEELKVSFQHAPDRTPDGFEAIARRLREEHPANPTAWWVWQVGSEDRTLWIETGDPHLTSVRVPYRAGTGRTHRIDRSYYWTVSELDEGRRVGLLIDASAQHRIVSGYTVTGLVGLGAATVLATLAGGLLARRVGLQLRRVARDVRAITNTSQEVRLRVTDAPVELHEVAEALGVMVDNIRADAEHARLLTAGLAHELRAPIQNLQGEAEVGLLRERTPSEYRAILESQLDELRDLGRVVDNLVTLTARGRPHGTSPTEDFDLGAEARLRVSRESAHARRRQVELRIETTGDLEVSGDREALILAIRNLVENAVQWSDAGHRVDLSIRAEGPDEIVVEVDDEGPGVPPAERARIFEPFVSTRALEGRRMGYGLGLALARTAVEAHGGTIAVAESPRGGARFTMRLPRRAA